MGTSGSIQFYDLNGNELVNEENWNEITYPIYLLIPPHTHKSGMPGWYFVYESEDHGPFATYEEARDLYMNYTKE